jgi:hypothetical protein
VKKVFSLVRKDKLDQKPTLTRGQKNKLLRGVKELMSEFGEKREGKMAAQIEDQIDSHNYDDVAVVVGRNHMGPMAEFLSNIDTYKVETYDAEQGNGILKSVKDKFF